MIISLSEDSAKLVRELIEAGQFSSPSEVVWHALCLLTNHGRTDAEKLEALRRDIQDGIDSGIAEPFDVEEILAEVRCKPLAAR